MKVNMDVSEFKVLGGVLTMLQFDLLEYQVLEPLALKIREKIITIADNDKHEITINKAQIIVLHELLKTQYDPLNFPPFTMSIMIDFKKDIEQRYLSIKDKFDNKNMTYEALET